MLLKGCAGPAGSTAADEKAVYKKEENHDMGEFTDDDRHRNCTKCKNEADL